MNFARIIFVLTSLLWQWAFADDLHYRNILIGEQASGLGGAYVAISDDPSGIFYNPAGIVFAMENYFSLSANAYMKNERKIKNVIAGQDYSYTSLDLVPTFFGLTQSHGKNKWGFGIIVPDQESYNQDDQILNISTENTFANSLKRKLFYQDKTYLVGLAYGTELFKDFTIGLSMSGAFRTRNAIDNQMILFNGGRYILEETVIDQNTMGLYSKFGLQYMPIPEFSLGATLGKMSTLQSKRTVRTVKLDSAISGGTPQETTVVFAPKFLSPWEGTLGLAYFPSKSSLYALDLMYFTSDPNGDDFTPLGTWNFSLGTEQYLSESLVLRLGLYSNHANTAELSPGVLNQLDHVDLYGLTTAVSLRSPGSSVAFGISYSQGQGQSQPLSGDAKISNMEEKRTALYLIGSYQL